MVETKKRLATVVGNIGKAFAWLGENGTKRPASFAWLVLLAVYCLDNFGGWGCTGLFPDILVWILQKFTGKEVRDIVLSSFYEFNEILDVTSELWKNYHFTGNTGKISVFTTRPYSTAVPTLQRVDYTDPKQLVTKNVDYEPVLYCNFLINIPNIISMTIIIIPRGIPLIDTHLMLMILIKTSIME